MRYKKVIIPRLRHITLLPLFALLSVNLLVESAAAQRGDVRFTDVTAALGISFKHTTGESGRKYFIEPLGSGVALFDLDNDSDLDLYFVNGADLPGSVSLTPPVNRLYRNDGDGRFTDVTERAGVGDTGFGFGCCVGDYDNDGFTDLYVTNYGRNVLYRNDGDGRFTDVTERAGVAGDRLSSGCAFVDVDADGYLDLYVVTYVEFHPDTNPNCTRQGVPTYCTPEALPGAADVLYRNNGDGTFTDVSERAGIAQHSGKGLGVVCGDLDNDGSVDIFVANDTTPNFLFHNGANGVQLTEDALFAGVALSAEGRAYSGMGTTLGDFDNDGALDIIVTNFQDQTNSLYHNTQDRFFTETSFIHGIGERSLPYLAWGVGFVDFNNDGWVDLFIANGHLDRNIAAIDPIGTYAQPNQLFLNRQGIAFAETEDATLAQPNVSRGTAFGDLDNDGDIDIVVSNLGGTPTVLRNDTPQRNRWLTVTLIGTHCNRSAIGARATFVSGALTQIREVKSGSGYFSQNDLRLHVGLGDAVSVDRLEVRWPCGRVQTLQDVAANQHIVISEE